jgi:hypothetical protein
MNLVNNDYGGQCPPYMTFHRYVKEGLLPEIWGEGISFKPTETFGE